MMPLFKQSLTSIVCLLLLTCVLKAQVPSLDKETVKQQQPASKVVFPDTVAGRQLAKWIQAFNSGDYDNIRAFYAATTTPDKVERDTLTAYEYFLDTRGWEIYKIDRSSEYEITFLAKGKVSDQWDMVRQKYAEQVPNPLIQIGYGYVYAPPGEVTSSRKKIDDGERVKQLRSLMKRLSAADIFSGTVLVAKEDKVIFEQAYGLASKAYNIPNRVDTKFNLASITKLFTAVAVVQLAQQGNLKLSDTVGKYLPDYPNKDVADKVTIHQLLTHTSGVGRGEARVSDKGRAVRHKLLNATDWFPLFVDRPLEFAPGPSYHYSNEGYIILGAIIEKASGQNYFDYIREHVFKPAGMINTDFYELDSDTPNMATGYTRFQATTRAQIEVRRNNLLLNLVKGMPAGGAYSTVADLLNFKKALFNHKLLNPEFTKLITTGQVETGEQGRKQAYGLEEIIVNGNRMLNLSGAIQGGDTRFEIYPALGYTVISLANYDYQVVYRRLRDILTQ